MLTNKSGTKWEILRILREHDEVTMAIFDDKIEVNSSTLNEHLSDLQAMNLIDKKTVRSGPGRPHYEYHLTEDAEHLFPHAYAELSKMLLEVIRTLSEEPEARKKITSIIKQRLDEFDDLKTALRTLGFYPEFNETNGNMDDVIYHQCPFYDVAKKDPALCDIDKAVLSEMIDEDVELERSIANGCNSCKFIVTQN